MEMAWAWASQSRKGFWHGQHDIILLFSNKSRIKMKYVMRRDRLMVKPVWKREEEPKGKRQNVENLLWGGRNLADGIGILSSSLFSFRLSACVCLTSFTREIRLFRLGGCLCLTLTPENENRIPQNLDEVIINNNGEFKCDGRCKQPSTNMFL